MSSFQTQYGLRLSKEIHTMPWEEFRQLLIGSDTPLGHIISIRSETDKNVLKHFTKDQKRIRSKWLSRKVKRVSRKDAVNTLEELKQAFISMAGR